MTWLVPTLLAPLFLGAAGDAPKPAPVALASFDDLEKRLNSPNLRLLDTRPRSDYETGHIPGAVWVDVKAASTLAARPGGLTDRDAWSAWVAPLAIGPDAEVLVVDGGRQLDAARVWWLLRYLGFDKVGLVNGNFPLWEAQKRPVTKESPAVEPKPGKVAFRADRHATRDDVRSALKANSARVIDARSDAEYTGEKKASKRGGHIPAACHLEWMNLVDKDGRFLEESALRTKLAGLGVKPGEAVITHCQGGGRASVDAFVFERLGFPTRNYYLGWSDWGNVDDVPIESGGKP